MSGSKKRRLLLLPGLLLLGSCGSPEPATDAWEDRRARGAIVDAPPASGSPAGVWEGGVDLPRGPLGLTLTVSQLPGGSWSGSWVAPAAGIREPRPLDDLRVEERAISFRIPLDDEVFAFAGVVSSDGRVLGGDATGERVTGSFAFRRAVLAPAEPGAP